MGCGRNSSWNGDPRARWERKIARFQDNMDRWSGGTRAWQSSGGGFSPSGNNAFDEYRTQTIQRLEEEAREFKSYLDRLRHAKDKAEFDQFMNERRNRQSTTAPSPATTSPHAAEIICQTQKATEPTSVAFSLISPPLEGRG